MVEEGKFSARDYLNSTGLRYLNFINGVSKESLMQSTKELSPLSRHLFSPRLIVDVGVGQGEETHSLVELYRQAGLEVIGVDMSDLALKFAQQRASENGLPISFVLANATNLPFETNSVSGVVLSSLLHEVYSYFPHGFEAWNQTIRGSARILEDGGCLFVRDSAGPAFKNSTEIALKTTLAQEFYEYFRKEFRAFDSWDIGSREQFKKREEIDRNHLPTLDRSGRVTLSQRYSAELIFHFFTFWKGYIQNVGKIGNIYWKEINEVYYLPYPLDKSLVLNRAEYIERVLEEADQELQGDGFRMVCVEDGESVRPFMDEVIQENFDIKLLDHDGGVERGLDELKNPFSRKMELIFRKVKIS